MKPTREQLAKAFTYIFDEKYDLPAFTYLEFRDRVIESFEYLGYDDMKVLTYKLYPDKYEEMINRAYLIRSSYNQYCISRNLIPVFDEIDIFEMLDGRKKKGQEVVLDLCELVVTRTDI